MGLEYCAGGELYDLIRDKSFDLETTRFYAAEIVSILEYLRQHDVVHRYHYSAVFVFVFLPASLPAVVQFRSDTDLFSRSAGSITNQLNVQQAV